MDVKSRIPPVNAPDVRRKYDLSNRNDLKNGLSPQINADKRRYTRIKIQDRHLANVKSFEFIRVYLWLIVAFVFSRWVLVLERLDHHEDDDREQEDGRELV